MMPESPLDNGPAWEDLAERMASLLGIRKSEPVERFCQMVAGFPEWGRQEATKVCCDALGWQIDPEEALKEANPSAALFRPPSVDDMRARLCVIVERMRVSEIVVITGLYHYLRNHFLGMAQSEHSSATIDKDLQWLKKMAEWRKLPLADRPEGFTDEMIDRAVPIIKEKASKRKEERMAAGAMAEMLEEKYEATFSGQYWANWLRRMAEEADEGG